MTSRTPIRLTPYRGPLATPSASPESSPTVSTPPTDISYCSTTIRGTLDVTILQHHISILSPPTQYQDMSRLYHQGKEIIRQGPFGHSTQLTPLSLAIENLLYSARELAKTLAGIATFCLFIWGLLEWSSYASSLPRHPSAWKSISQFPLPSTARALRCHMNTSACQPSDQHGAVLQFLSEHIQHAKHLSSLSIGLGLPFRAFLETHREAIPRAVVQHSFSEPPHFVQEVDALVNLTEFLDASLLDFSPGGFIGRSFTLALEELGDLISEPTIPYASSTRGDYRDGHLHAIYWRIASNLLLEYSAARPRVKRLSQHLRILYQQLSLLVSGDHVAGSIEERLDTRWWNAIIRHPTTEDGVRTFVAGLEVTLDNVRRLTAYLDWITEQLAQSTLQDVLKTRHRTNFSSCMMSLQELFDHSRPLASKKICFCLNDYGFIPPARPERVEIMVPGSPTVRAKR